MRFIITGGARMNEELYQMMKRMEEANRKQEEYARKQYRMTVIMASACVGVLILAVLCVCLIYTSRCV